MLSRNCPARKVGAQFQIAANEDERVKSKILTRRHLNRLHSAGDCFVLSTRENTAARPCPSLVLPSRRHTLLLSDYCVIIESLRSPSPFQTRCNAVNFSYAEHEKRFLHLNALYEQACSRIEFLECTKQCERSLTENIGMSAYCILVGAHENWKAAEVKHRKLETNRKRFTQLT